MGQDEAATVRDLKGHQAAILPLVGRHGGRIVDTAGDGILAEFPSVVAATECAVEIQAVMAARNADVPEQRRMLFRIGINLGDVVHDEMRIYGDGINVAARLEALAAPGGVLVSHAVHEQVRDRLALAFEDLGERELKNIARPVRVFRLRAPGEAAAAALAPTLWLPEQPSIAVLPFANMSGDPEQEYFVDGLVEDIITALSRTRALFVIARNSSFSYKGKSPDIRQVGRELGVRYVLEGSVRKASNRLRITGQLIDAQNGVHIWADRFDGELADIFELQDQVAARVVVAIVPTLERVHMQRSSTKPTESLDAYDCCLRGWACIDQFTREANVKALAYFERAIELDPRFALAWAQAASCYIQRVAWRWSAGSERERNETERLLRKALELDPDDPRVLALSGFALGRVLGLNDEGLALIEKATDLDPNYSFAWLQRGFACLRVGKPAISHLERALRLNPRDVRAPFAKGNGLAVAYMYEGDYGKAIELAEESLKQLPDFPPILMTLIVSRAHAGQIEEARKAVEALLAIRPQATISSMVDDNGFPAYRRILVEGFRLAGMPE